MAKLQAAIAEAGQELGLRQQTNGPSVFGEIDGYLVQLVPVQAQQAAFKMDGGTTAGVLIRHGDWENDAALRDAVSDNPQLHAAGIKPKNITVEDGLLMYQHAGGHSGNVIRDVVEALLETLRRVAPPPADACRLCESGGANPRLLGGVVDRVCDDCVEKLQEGTRAAQAAYDARPTRYTFALTAAMLSAAVGAAVWAGIGIGTGSMWWLIAIGIGWVVGMAVSKAAGKGGIVIQAMSIAATVLSVLAGNVMMYAWWISERAQEEGGEVDWNAFFAAIPALLQEDMGSTVFAIGGGLFGAVGAAKATAAEKYDTPVD